MWQISIERESGGRIKMKNNIFTDEVFKIAFAISIVSHSLLFLKAPGFSFVPNNKETEIIYYIQQKPDLNQDVTSLDNDMLAETAQNKNKRSIEKVAVEVIVPEKCREEKKIQKVVRQDRKEEISRVPQNKIVINEDIKNIPGDVQKDALYNSTEFYDYHRYLRDRIKQTVFHPRPFSEGEIVVRFMLFCNGVLKEISVVDDLSASNGCLRYAAIKSVKDAAPFKSFPEKLAVKEMLFQVPISFEISE